MRALPLSDIHCGRVLAPDETIVWQGRPSWRGIALQALHVRPVAAYFGAVVVLGLVEMARGHATLQAALTPLVPGIITVAMLGVFAVLIARSTRYLVTSDRLILRYGVVFPRSLSIPFRMISSLALTTRGRGRGDIAFGIMGESRVSYPKMWPHVRPWRLSRPEPMLRDVVEAGLVATQVSRQLSWAERQRRENAAETTLVAQAVCTEISSQVPRAARSA